MNPLTPEETLSRRWETIESIQNSVIQSGGQFIPREKIENMKIGDFLNMVLPNYIVVRASFDTHRYVELQKK
jgi:hypothetical protein